MGTLGLITITILALVVLVQLWRVLGVYDPTQVHKPQHTPPNTNAMPAVPPSNISNVLTESEQQTFLQGARQAYSTLIQAMIDGDLTPCLSWLEPPVRAHFSKQLAEQKAAGHVLTLRENTIIDAQITHYSVENGLQEAIVQYQSRIVYATSADAQPVTQNMVYTWTFSKLAHAPQNTWRLSAAQAETKTVDALPAA